jgi:ABC-type branched-subunit amino acid transport system ATPase component
MEKLLEVDDVRHAFGGLVAVAGASFSVRPNSILGLIGPNGAGKSTLVDVITGFKRIQHGRVRFDGHPIGGLAPHSIARKGLVRTFQVSRGFPHLTCLETMLVSLRTDDLAAFLRSLATRSSTRKSAGRIDIARCTDVLNEYGLGGQVDLYAEELSGGQLKLLDIARASLMAPRCLLLDEPMAGVSPVMIEALVGHLKRLRERGATVLIIEHNLDVVNDLCDEVVMLAGGKVLAQGQLSDLRKRSDVVSAYLN